MGEPGGRKREMTCVPATLALVLVAGLAQAAARPALPPGIIGPASTWIDPIAVDTAAQAPDGQVSRGVHYLLIDRQTRVHERSREVFVHYAKKIVNGAGLENAANLSIEYEPSF